MEGLEDAEAYQNIDHKETSDVGTADFPEFILQTAYREKKGNRKKEHGECARVYGVNERGDGYKRKEKGSAPRRIPYKFRASLSAKEKHSAKDKDGRAD